MVGAPALMKTLLVICGLVRVKIAKKLPVLKPRKFFLGFFFIIIIIIFSIIILKTQ